MPVSGLSVSEIFEEMKVKLGKLVPEVELRYKAELVQEINALKAERNAIILGHNYMEPALFHTVCDLVGDSLGLAREAATTKCDPIIFCGVRFMAETAKILNPERMVLLPAKEAGCSLAAGITAEDVRALRARFPEAPAVVYINTYTDVKAEVDICCTSSNAARVMDSLKAPQILFLPDEYLARNVAEDLGRSIAIASRDQSSGEILIDGDPNSEVIGWNARCEVHEQFQVSDIENARAQFDDIAVLSHPECSPEVVAASDYSDSTTKMVDYVSESSAPHFLILTECSMGDNIIAENPDKDIVRMCSIRCPHMNEITLEDTLKALRENFQQIEVDPAVADRARSSLERMLAI